MLLVGNGHLIGWVGSNLEIGCGSNGVADFGIVVECVIFSFDCIELDVAIVDEKFPTDEAFVGVGATGVE